MKSRMDISEVEPDAYKAMFGLENYLKSIALDSVWKQLIKIRASQINGCAYCIEMHSKEARTLGVPEQKLYALSAWKESPRFSDEERVILAMTEEITHLSKEGLSEETWLIAAGLFSDNTIAQIIMQITTINAWNRIVVSTHFMHDEKTSATK